MMRKNILVADDNSAIRRAVCRMIEEDDRLAPCLVAENGLQAVEVAAQKKPDLVVMMPRMNGLDASKRIKEILPDVPIVLLSFLQDCGRSMMGPVGPTPGCQQLSQLLKNRLSPNVVTAHDSGTIAITFYRETVQC